MNKMFKIIRINKLTQFSKKNSLLSRLQINAKKQKSTLKLLTDEIYII